MEVATTEGLETRQQCEKDRAALLAQVKLLEAELEEQVSRHRACASQAEELCALRQQMVSLDKHLRSQRQFMDVSTLCFVDLPGSHLYNPDLSQVIK